MKKNLLLSLSLSVIIFSCKKSEPTPASGTSMQDVVNQYAEVAYQQYNNAYVDGLALQVALNLLVAEPTSANFEAAKEAWMKSRTSYSLTESYRFYGGPIDNPDTDYEGEMNSWPMDESAIDYVYINYSAGTVNDSAGIINRPDLYPIITGQLLRDNNGKAGETSITTGYHAIEFLLWGQDFNPDGPGQRAFTDYLTVSGTHFNQIRRGQYLVALAALLVSDLKAVTDGWVAGNTTNFRASFTKESNLETSMTDIFKGLGTFCKSEYGGDRLNAYYTKDQEDEHDCFSDYTTKDIVLWEKGVINVYYGKYTKADGTIVDGVGIDDILKLKDNTMSANMDFTLTNTYAATLKVPDPFDKAIMNPVPNPNIKTVIDSVRSEGDKFVDIALKFGYTITTDN